MSHRHFCDVAGHWWPCEGLALRRGDNEPSVCMCLKCGVPLESGDHSHDYVELIACPEHRKTGEPKTAPGVKRRPTLSIAPNPIVGFCLWCDKDFYSMEEVEAHNADGMKPCPVHQELTSRPGGYPYMPPVLQEMMEQAGLLDEDGPAKDGQPNPGE